MPSEPLRDARLGRAWPVADHSSRPRSAFIPLPAGVAYPVRRVTHDESDPNLARGPTVPNKNNFASVGSGASGLTFGSAANKGKRARLE